MLRGKNKPTFTPNVDTGDFVIVINSDKVVLTGKKTEDKFYRYHTGYVGGLKEISYKKMLAEKSDLAVYEAVKGMLPKNSLGERRSRNSEFTRVRNTITPRRSPKNSR